MSVGLKVFNEAATEVFNSQVMPWRFVRRVNVPQVSWDSFDREYLYTWEESAALSSPLVAVDIPSGLGVWWRVTKRGSRRFPLSYYNAHTQRNIYTPANHNFAIGMKSTLAWHLSPASLSVGIFDRIAPEVSRQGYGLEVFDGNGDATLSSSHPLLGVSAVVNETVPARNNYHPRIYLGTHPSALVIVSHMHSSVSGDMLDGAWLYIERVGDQFFASTRYYRDDPTERYSHDHRLACAFVDTPHGW